MEYNVEFHFETGTTVDVEADSPEEAVRKALVELDDRSVDSLPEMWPGDFVAVAVNEGVAPYQKVWDNEQYIFVSSRRGAGVAADCPHWERQVRLPDGSIVWARDDSDIWAKAELGEARY